MHIIKQSPLSMVLLTVHAACSVRLDKCVRTSVHHYSVTLSSVTALTPPPSPPCPIMSSLLSPSPQPLADTDLVTVALVFPFPECRGVGIAQYTVF